MSQIDLYCATLSEFAHELGALECTLSASERSQAERFHFSGDRTRYVIRCGLLRRILSRYLEISSDEIVFSYGPFGKPEIISEKGHSRLHFSVSHSHGLAIYAVTRCCPVGVDVEFLRPVPDARSIAELYFSGKEVKALTEVAEKFRPEAFLRLWTRKEAWLKATGEGLSGLDGLRELDLSSSSEAFTVASGPANGVEYCVRSLSPGPGCLAALAFQSPCKQAVQMNVSNFQKPACISSEQPEDRTHRELNRFMDGGE
jgi:4'-phosphopantetheinyl transferase